MVDIVVCFIDLLLLYNVILFHFRFLRFVFSLSGFPSPVESNNKHISDFPGIIIPRRLSINKCVILRNLPGGTVVDLGPWAEFEEPADVDMTEADQTVDKTTDGHIAMKRFNEWDDPVLIFNERGFKVGQYVKEKGVDSQDVYQIKGMTDVVELWLFDVFGIREKKVCFTLPQFLVSWNTYNVKLPEKLPHPKAGKYHDKVLSDELRVEAFKVLLQHERDADKRPLLYMTNPSVVVASEEICKGSLRLAPLVPLSNLGTEKKPGGVKIPVNGENVYVSPLPKVSHASDIDKNVVVPFWWIEFTKDEELGNMRYASVKVDGITIPVLQNTRKIKVLWCHKPTKRSKPHAS